MLLIQTAALGSDTDGQEAAIAEIRNQFAAAAPGGVLNLGSGVPLPTGRLALWLIEGHGRGRLVVDSPEERDAFLLDTSSLRGLLGGAGCDLAALRAACLALGRRLRTETPPA